MKLTSFFWSFLTVLALSTATVGCDDDDTIVTPPNPGVDAPVLTLSSSVLNAAAEGGEQILTFKIENYVENRKVAATSEAQWFVLKAETNGAEGRIVLQVEKNEGEAREAEVTVTYEGAKDAKFTVRQAAAAQPDAPVLTLSSATLEVAAAGGEQIVSFTIENPVEGQKVAAASDARWFTLNAETNGAEGRIVLAVEANETQEAREAVVTVTYEGAEDARFTVKQAAAESKGPKLEFSLNYNKADKLLCMNLISPSKDVQTGYLMFLASEWVDAQLNGRTLDELFNEIIQSGAAPMDPEMIKTMNGDGFKETPVMAWEPDLDGTIVSGIICVENAEGRTTARADALLGEGGGGDQPSTGDGPQLTYVGRAEAGMLYFTATSSTRNVASGEVLVNGKTDFDDFLAAVGGDFNKLIDGLSGMGQTLPKEWCEQINSDLGLELQVENPDTSLVYASLMIVYDAENHRSYGYATAEEKGGSTEPMKGALDVEFTVTGDSDAFALNAICRSKNAANAYVAWNDPTAIDGAVESGATFESIMDEAKAMGKAQQFDKKWINSMNGKGIGLSLQANPGTRLAFLLDVSNEDSRVVKRADAETTQPYTGPSYVKQITDAQFRELVWDYNANPSKFTLKGTKPCVLDFGAPAWCGWCVKLQPVMNQASATYKDKVDFYEIDTDKDTEAVTKMRALLGAGTGVPLLIVVDAQGNCKQIGGYVPYRELCAEIDAILGTTKTVQMVRLNNAGDMKGMAYSVRKRVMISKTEFSPRSTEPLTDLTRYTVFAR